jgi:hypothetical protein
VIWGQFGKGNPPLSVIEILTVAYLFDLFTEQFQGIGIKPFLGESGGLEGSLLACPSLYGV